LENAAIRSAPYRAEAQARPGVEDRRRRSQRRAYQAAVEAGEAGKLDRIRAVGQSQTVGAAPTEPGRQGPAARVSPLLNGTTAHCDWRKNVRTGWREDEPQRVSNSGASA